VDEAPDGAIEVLVIVEVAREPLLSALLGGFGLPGGWVHGGTPDHVILRVAFSALHQAHRGP